MMKVIWVLILAVLCSTAASADDLYHVEIESELDARRLTETGADPVIRLTGSYLVLINEQSITRLNGSGLEYSIVAQDVNREQLVLDKRRDTENIGKYPMLYEEGGIRLYRADPVELMGLSESGDFMPIGERRPKIAADVTQFIDYSAVDQMLDLEWLISQVSQDSLETYVYRLQAYYRRVVETPTNLLAVNWIASKFVDFGYDSVVIDNFAEASYECRNVLAYKIGTRYPNHHVVIGAHHDAVPNSPGADDNGSGTAGVIEMARILKDVETDMTIVFALFDAEEVGLYGSWHYADEAYARGDSIVYMLNMDMIAHYENDIDAALYHGADITYSRLWQVLADSLTGLAGHLSGGSAYSDHHPFDQNGYPVTFVAEYIFSNVYHSAHDSTSYMDFEYMTKMVKASLATAYMVNATAGPRPALAFDYPGGVPDLVPPGVTATLEVSISGVHGGLLQPGSAQLHYSTDGFNFAMVPMTATATDHFEAAVPPMLCDQRLSFFISAVESEGVTFYDPVIAGYREAYVGTARGPAWVDNFEADSGWTVSGSASAGHWERGIPIGDGVWGDPLTDYDGSGQCFLTGNAAGESDVDAGSAILTSPTFDLTVGGDPEISYARWFSNSAGDNPYSDYLVVMISNNNGLTWKLVEFVGPVEGASGGWYEYSFLVSDIISLSSQMKIRFSAADNGGASAVEAAVDAFTITRYMCDGEEDWDEDGVLNLADNCPFTPNPQQENNDGDEWGNICDDDDDNDGLPDGADNCPFAANEDQSDTDGDGLGDACDDCDCTGQGDLNNDEAINPVDVVLMVNYVYRSLDSREPLATTCAVGNGDWDCSGDINPVDVVYYTNFVYKATGANPCDPCDSMY